MLHRATAASKHLVHDPGRRDRAGARPVPAPGDSGRGGSPTSTRCRGGCRSRSTRCRRCPARAGPPTSGPCAPTRPSSRSSSRASTTCGSRSGSARSRPPRSGRCLMVTSAIGGEGKTTLAAHLAVCCAKAGISTLVIDADMRRAALSRMFEEEQDGGPQRRAQGRRVARGRGDRAPTTAVSTCSPPARRGNIPVGCSASNASARSSTAIVRCSTW